MYRNVTAKYWKDLLQIETAQNIFEEGENYGYVEARCRDYFPHKTHDNVDSNGTYVIL